MQGSLKLLIKDENGKKKPSTNPPVDSIITKKVLELFEWIAMIVLKNWPLSSVEDVLNQERTKHKRKFSINTV